MPRLGMGQEALEIGWEGSVEGSIYMPYTPPHLNPKRPREVLFFAFTGAF